jgi:hypothetical protein
VKAFILGSFMCASLFLHGGAPVFAQLAADPNDRLYTDLEMWMDRALTERLPPLRPYPVQLVRKILSDVVASGTEADRKLAGWYLSKIGGDSSVHGVAGSLARTDTVNGSVELDLEASMQGSLSPLLTYSARLGAVALSTLSSTLLPKYQRSGLDYISDPSVTSIGGLYPRMSLIGSGTIGTDELYLQAGAIRGSYGPFWGDNAVLSPSSPQSGQLSFVFHDNAMSFTMMLMDFAATGPTGGSVSPDKFLSVGGLEFYPVNGLTLGVFDAVVWGQRFEPLYILPVVSFYTQGLVGFPDNSFIGVSGAVQFPGAVKVSFLLYVDDASFNDLVRLDFNTKLKAAFQVGASWTPDLPFLARLRVTNLLVTPYTYTHVSYSSSDAANFLNYTNNGQNIGPSLQPNSDRIDIEALIRPVSWVDLNLFGRLILHGNASAGIPGLSHGDGTINDSGITGSGDDTTLPPSPLPAGISYLRFLTQPVIEKVTQAGFDATASFETSVGEVQVSLSYTFEYVFDAGLSTSNALNNYFSFGVSFIY